MLLFAASATLESGHWLRVLQGRLRPHSSHSHLFPLGLLTVEAAARAGGHLVDPEPIMDRPNSLSPRSPSLPPTICEWSCHQVTARFSLDRLSIDQ